LRAVTLDDGDGGVDELCAPPVAVAGPAGGPAIDTRGLRLLDLHP
jgi:hypothetical protein